MSSKPGIIIVGCALGAFAVACSGSSPSASPPTDTRVGDTDSGAGTAAQLNDLSILFPLAHTSSEYATGYLSPSSSGARGELLPRALYDATSGIFGSAGDQMPAPYANFRVVSMRVDPCFAELAPSPHGDGCKNQIRLVVQELKLDGSGASAFDSAIHLFYDLTREELAGVVRALVALRASNSSGERLGALAPHPIMVKQGLTGAMAAGVRALILSVAGKDNLSRITFMSGNAGSRWNFGTQDPPWIFEGYDVQAAGLVPMAIPTLPPDNGNLQFLIFSFTPALKGQAVSATASADKLDPFFDPSSATVSLTPAQRAATYDSLLKIENPTTHSANTIDCVSCHIAHPLAKLVAEPKFSFSPTGNPRNFVPDGVSVLPNEMSATFDDAGRLNVHAFSYDGTRPGISQRTVNETAAIVAYVNAFAR